MPLSTPTHTHVHSTPTLELPLGRGPSPSSHALLTKKHLPVLISTLAAPPGSVPAQQGKPVTGHDLEWLTHWASGQAQPSPAQQLLLSGLRGQPRTLQCQG